MPEIRMILCQMSTEIDNALRDRKTEVMGSKLLFALSSILVAEMTDLCYYGEEARNPWFSLFQWAVVALKMSFPN